MSRNGDVSESEESCVRVGGNGEPLVFLARNPALKRLCFGLVSVNGTGGAGIGEESVESDESVGWFAKREVDDGGGGGMVGSIEDVSGVRFARWGVFSNSASAPSSVSSRHRTPLFSPFTGDFFLGVKETPFLAATALRRLGEARTGEPKFEMSANEAP